jgi:hypothetical protein
MDSVDPAVLAVLRTVGNANANLVLEEKKPADVGLRPGATRGERTDFITRQYKGEFVNSEPTIGLAAAVLTGQLQVVYRELCQLRKVDYPPCVADCLAHSLRLAACCGDRLIVALLAMNTEAIDATDQGGWSALSYAAWAGEGGAAEVLLALGASASAAPLAHPYMLPRSRSDSQMAAMFADQWREDGAQPFPPVDELHPVLESEVARWRERTRAGSQVAVGQQGSA